MGLLDDLLGQLAGPAMTNRQAPAARADAGGGPGMTAILMALMPVVLAMPRSTTMRRSGARRMAGCRPYRALR